MSDLNRLGNRQEAATAGMPEKKRPPRAAYALPTLFTAGNIFLGYLSIVRTIQGALNFGAHPALSQQDFEVAAKTIGLAVVLDGLDGRIARMTNTTSEFGRELDSLADIVSFGIAPAILAYIWGVRFVTGSVGTFTLDQLQRAGTFLAFLFLACGAARLARFNITKNPVPANPGAIHRKYFVGLPIPAGAGMVAAIVFSLDGDPLTGFIWSALWLCLLALLAFLMVSAWRYWSFKEFNLQQPRSTLILASMCAVIAGIWLWPKPVVLVISAIYVFSGLFIRIGGIVRRLLRPGPKYPEAEIE